MKNIVYADCAACSLPMRERVCVTPKGKGSKGCPTLGKKKLIEKAMAAYEPPEIREFARQASIQEGECYAGRTERPYVVHPTKPRILEICEFSRRTGYKRLGLAFCAGLAREAAVVEQILGNHGFEVVSVICKMGSIPKEAIGIQDSEKVYVSPRHETMCNPVFQAMALNEAKTDFNVLLGLCVGHDSLFFKHAEAPTTVLAVKDRVNGHNPLAAIYTSQTYYEWINKA
jgi:uncharacterized metal-binding protein